MDREILHCDLNNFYASVECLYNPALWSVPMAVCGSIESRHGIVLAKNILAKQAGIKTGQVIWQAKNICPGLVLVRPDMKKYLRFSRKARNIYERYTGRIESFGIDECWLDVSGSNRAADIGESIRTAVREELGITISVGVSWNKIFAKLGSDLQKPDALTDITRQNYKARVWPLPAQELLYVGRSTQRKLNRVGLYTIGDIACAAPEFLRTLLGKWGYTLWIYANGLDDSVVNTMDFERDVKGVGNSTTTPRDLTCDQDVKLVFFALAESVAERLRNHGFRGKTLAISIKDNELNYITRQCKLQQSTFISRRIAETAMALFHENWNFSKPIRALGVRMTDLEPVDSCRQISFLTSEKDYIDEKLECTIDSIRGRFGHYSIQRGICLIDNRLNVNPIDDHIVYPGASDLHL